MTFSDFCFEPDFLDFPEFFLGNFGGSGALVVGACETRSPGKEWKT